MIFEHTSYREFLRAVLAERRERNSGYSLRAMARDLGMGSSQLSGVHKGTKSLSTASAVQVARKLGLSTREREYFCLMVQAEGASDEDLREAYLQQMKALNPAREIHDLSVDAFKAIAEWYHIPIVELTTLDGFVLTPDSASEKLGIPRLEAEVAIERLARLGLLERDGAGAWKKAFRQYLFESRTPRAALQRFHTQILERAKGAVADARAGEDYFGSETVSIDPAQWEQAREMIGEFRQKLVALLDQGKRRTRTCHLEIAFFNLTRKKEKQT